MPSDGEERAQLHLESEQVFPHAKREVESDNEGEAEVVRCNDGVVLRDAAGEGGDGICRGKTSRHVAQVVVCSMNSNTNRTVACALLCVIGCACLFASD